MCNLITKETYHIDIASRNIANFKIYPLFKSGIPLLSYYNIQYNWINFRF